MESEAQAGRRKTEAGPSFPALAEFHTQTHTRALAKIISNENRQSKNMNMIFSYRSGFYLSRREKSLPFLLLSFQGRVSKMSFAKAELLKKKWSTLQELSCSSRH